MLKPPKCDKKTQSTIRLMWVGIFAVLIVSIASFFAYQGGYQNGRDSHLTTRGYVTPIVDGKITEEEWDRSNLYMYPQWIRFDNTSKAENNWNYLSVGQDDYNLYINLDMVSLTQTLDFETLEIYLILNNDYFTNFQQYMILQEWGVEALIYDVGEEEILIDDQKNTLDDPNIALSYSPSINSEEPHRIVEISILKENMRYYDSLGELGILVIGNYEEGSYYFAAASPTTNVVFYDSSAYIGIDMGNNEEIYI